MQQQICPDERDRSATAIWGNTEATFTEMWNRWRPKFFGIARQYLKHHDADDAVGDLALRMWRAWTKYDPARARADTWGQRILQNLIRDYFRSWRHRHQVEAGAALDQHLSNEVLGDERLELNDLQKAIRACEEKLPPRARTLFRERMKGASLGELSEQFGRSPEALSSLYCRAVQALKECLTRNHFGHEENAMSDEAIHQLATHFELAFFDFEIAFSQDPVDAVENLVALLRSREAILMRITYLRGGDVTSFSGEKAKTSWLKYRREIAEVQTGQLYLGLADHRLTAADVARLDRLTRDPAGLWAVHRALENNFVIPNATLRAATAKKLDDSEKTSPE